VSDELPIGTVTFLFTDIEGSTRLLRELGKSYGPVLDDHARLMREAIAAGAGTEIRTEGDSFFAVFPTATGAVLAAAAAQRALAAHRWSHGPGLRVRMGMHTGEGRRGGDDYIGIDVNRAARIAAAGHGGQVLLSDATRALVADALPDRVSLRDLGEHRLKGFDLPQRIHQLVIEELPSDFAAIRSLEVPKDLPVQLTSFVGRGQELTVITGLAERSRLVTLTGPGGTGKTRLAVEAARRLAERFADGVHFVDLSPITDPQLVANAIASALRLREEGGRPVLEIISDHLRDRTSLLVLDNFEQVLPGGQVVATLLRAAPKLRVLVTSRAPLGLTGERDYPVPPLELPDPEGDPAALLHSEAVDLFADRAGAVDPGFSITDENIRIVAEICARLEGLPLAIELAASRIRVLPPRALLERLDLRLPVLVGGPQDAPDRQRTLRAAIAWSYDLLEQRVQTFFLRLSVFAGGWTLQTAEDVVNPAGELGDTVELVETLLQHSLVKRDDPDDPGERFRMLETIREFGVERLQTTAGGDDVRRRHARRFLDLAEEADGRLIGSDQRRWLELLSREHDNFRTALRWAIEGDHGETGLRLGSSLSRFWQMRGHLDEGHRWLDAVLALPSSATSSIERARCLSGLGAIANWQGEVGTVIAAHEESLRIRREIGDPAGTAQALQDLGMARNVSGDPTSAQVLAEESLAIYRQLGDPHGEAWGLWALGAALCFQGDLEGARKQLEESLRIFDELGDDRSGLGNVITGLGVVAAIAGDPREASARILQAMDLAEEAQDALAISSQLEVLAAMANATGRPERAVRLAGATAMLKEKTRGQAPPAMLPFPDPREVAAKLLDPASLERAWAEGRAMTLEEALAYARRDASPNADP
jgi:predicted ATPase/class 3 adenylate cyclase